MTEQLALLPEYLTAHLQLSLVALTVALVVSVPLGMAVVRWRRAQSAVLGVASVVQTIPSLALLALMVPTLAFLGAASSRLFGVELRSIGYLPAVVALTLYSVLPILRNTVTGLSGIDPVVDEAARAVGMTDRQRLLRVQLPLALPVIIAGLRTATVWVVGTATLSTPVGATSLGNYIFSGLQTRNLTAVMIGCISAAVLALSLDSLIRAVELGIAKRKRSWIAVPAAIVISLFAYLTYAAATFATGRSASQPSLVTIGGKTFTEQYILTELLDLYITRETGHPTRILQSLGSTVAFNSLLAGDIDVYVDYSGTIWANIMRQSSPPERPEELLPRIREYLARNHGVTLAASLGFENRYALGMKRQHARTLGVETISQLAPHSPKLSIAADYEFFARPEWKAIRATYGLQFARRRPMDSALMYQAVWESQVDVISAFSTDGRIQAYDIALLNDDRRVIPPYDAIVLAGERVSKTMPEVLQTLERLDRQIDVAAMRQMNLQVDRGGQLPRAVAEAFLEEVTTHRNSQTQQPPAPRLNEAPQ